ncbi:MAG: site-2 protease family protein [Gammaproteobacteria bacterium]|jgi:Zn-dependent protease/predicted transcriptional regulator|nr:site-2 protease family protein [Gammaproteobacteria bacterium]
MFGQRIALFTLFGLEVRANTSWVLLAVLVFWSLATGFFPARLPGLAVPVYWLLGLTGMLGVFFSLLFHEFAHSLVARARGMEINGITLFLFGGAAEMASEPPTPRIEFEVAIAGPLASLALFLGFGLIAGLLAQTPLPEYLAALFGYLSLINLILAVFNLFPGFPLDGGRVLRAWLWHRRGDLLSATLTASRMGQGFGLALVLIGFWTLLSVGALGGLWWILIGIFVIGVARAAYEQTALRVTFEGTPIRRFMAEHPVSVSPDLDLASFIEDHAYRDHYSAYPVTDHGRLIGRVRTRDVKQIAREDWTQQTLRRIMTPLEPDQLAHPDDDAQQVLDKMQRSRSGQIIVADGDRVLGIVTLADLLNHLALKRDLEA